jgi:energy-coupling factor transport system substrate-specific component
MKHNNSIKIPKLSVKDITLIGILSATLIAAKMALSFLPNIEIVSLLIIVFTLTFGFKTLYSILVFTCIETFIWGMGLWTIIYLYIWAVLVVITYIFRKQDSVWFWSIVSGIFGLCFGALGSIVYLFVGGTRTAFAWWIAGIPWDVVHCIGNFVLALVLYKPLMSVLRKMKKLS